MAAERDKSTNAVMAQNAEEADHATGIAAVRVLRSQMPFAYQTSAVEIATAALEKCGAGQGGALDLKQVAGAIKQEYDKRYPGTGKATDGVYHCVVGDHFACGPRNAFSVNAVSMV